MLEVVVVGGGIAGFAAALALESLTQQQRAAVAEMNAEFRRRYDELCDQMVAVKSAASNGDESGGWNPARWRQRMERERGLEKVRADRDDLNHKTTLRLRALLGPEQSKRLGLGDAG